MKRHVLLAGALLLSIAASATAQTADSLQNRRSAKKPLRIETVHRDSTGIDTLRRIDALNNDLIRLRAGGSDGDVILEAGGFGLRLGRTFMQHEMERRPRFWGEVLSDMQFGFTRLTGVDYSGYDPAAGEFLDQRLGASFHFSFSPVRFCMGLNRSRSLALGVGLQYTLDNIRLTNSSITLGNDDGRLVPVGLDASADKSKIIYSSLGIPLQFSFSRRGMRVAVTAYTDFLLGADAIYKKPKHRQSLSGFRSVQFGLGASISYCGFGFYVRHTLTPLFREGKGPECRTLSFGFSYSLYLF